MVELPPGALDAGIREQVACFQALGVSFEWKVFDHDQPPGLADHLQAHGFRAGEWEATMVVETTKLAVSPATPAGISIRRVADPDEARLIDEVHDAAWGEQHPRRSIELAKELREAPADLSVYVAEAAGRPVSCAWVRFTPACKFAGLFGGSTVPAFRRRGIYRTLVALRAAEALARGYGHFYVDASPASRPILERAGFVCVSGSRPCLWSLPAEPPTVSGGSSVGDG